MKKIILLSIFILYVAALVLPSSALAASACSTVKIEILQELTLERIAFDAKLRVANNIPDKSLTNVRVDLVIRDAAGNDKSSLFFVRAPECTPSSFNVSGTGSVPASTEGVAHWLIIPSPGAGGTDPAGVLYWVGATMTYTVNGQQETLPINPCSITVKPEAQLYLDYFTPYQVLGDNPFTPQTEAPVPYPLAVRVMNDGYGPAKSLKITSAQPKIVENTQGLLIDFRILGSSVNDSPVTNTLAPALGNVASKKCATASWQMICTLSGRFVDFKVSFTHASELGGELTSLVKETNAHYLVHMVRNNLPGRDARLDYLGGDVAGGKLVPTYMMESEIPPGKTERADSVSQVATAAVTVAPTRPTPDEPEVYMTIQQGTTGWVYASTEDPGRGLLKLLNVARADGTLLDPNNFWIQEYLDENYQRHFSLNILDYRASADTTGVYKLVYQKPADDSIAPTTKLIYDGPAVEDAGNVYVTPQTKIIFSADDNEGGSGVDQMLKKLSGTDADYAPAFPFNLPDPGSYSLSYYSTDRALNSETPKTAVITVDDAAPQISAHAADPASFSPGAAIGIKAQRTVDIVLTVSDSVNNLPIIIEIAKGEGDFASLQIIKKITTTATTGEPLRMTWDGRCDDGTTAPVGNYTIRATVTDGLNASASDTSHTSSSTAALTVADWFAGRPLDPDLAGEQVHPKVSGTRVVWQDKRSGRWQVRIKDITGGSSTVIGSGTGDAERPSIDGDIIAWQDNRSGGYRVYWYDLNTGQEQRINSDPSGAYPARSEERPVVSGDWIAWQDDRSGNKDIFACDISTGEVRQITNHERDQINPAISGGMLYWEDYRHGAAELYSYDLASGTETRLTFNNSDQTAPAVSGGLVVWTDNRNGGKDIYMKDGPHDEARVSYGTGDEDQPAVLGSTIAYTDFAKGADDTELAFFDASAGIGGGLTDSPGRQEEPAIGDGYVLWQDDRDSVFQIYYAPFNVEPVPVEAAINKGYNLIAAGSLLANTYPTASALIDGVRAEIAVDRVMIYDALHGAVFEAADGQTAGDDFAVTPGSGVVLYAGKPGSLKVADSGEQITYTLLPGMNQVGIVKAPFGYRAYDLMNSVGLDNVQSARRFNPETGGWETASVRFKDNANEIVGVNFPVRPGDGLIITMKQRVDGWRP